MAKPAFPCVIESRKNRPKNAPTNNTTSDALCLCTQLSNMDADEANDIKMKKKDGWKKPLTEK